MVKRKARKRCRFVPKYGVVGKESDVENLRLSDIDYAIRDIKGACNRSYWIGERGPDRQIMVKIATKDRASAKRVKSALKKASLDHLVRGDIYPWGEASSFW